MTDKTLQTIEKEDRWLLQRPDGTWETKMKPGRTIKNKVVGVRLSEELSDILNELPNKAKFLQALIEDAVRSHPDYEAMKASAEAKKSS